MRPALGRVCGGGRAFVFDIDGVLLRGSAPLPGAREALLSLYRSATPFILLTNGGGELEASKAARLSQLLDLPIHTSQVVLSHTPMRPLCAALGAASARVLVLGCKNVVQVARSYGLEKVDTPQCLLHDTPALYPFLPVATPRRLPEAHREQPFAAVLVLHDPNSWGLELQVALDVLRGGSPLGSGTLQAVPYYASNPDLTFAGAYEGAPRLAGGAFTTALRAMWEATHPAGGALTTTFFGKPTRATFEYARRALGAWAAAAEASGWHARVAASPSAALREEEARGLAQLAGAPGAGASLAFERIAMVGDNPKADIAGANAAGAPWVSALVRTGVWRGEALAGLEAPSASYAGVAEAVRAQLA